MTLPADISVIVPIYNERQSIRRVVEEVLESGLGERLLEVIVVDDGSTDGSAATLSGLPKVRVVRHEENQGLSAGVASGYREAQGRYVVKLDGDGQHPAELLAGLPAMLAEADVVWWVRESMAGTTLARGVSRWGLSRLAEVVTGHRFPDILSGFYCCRRELVMPLLEQRPGGMTFDAWLLLKVHALGCRIRLAGYVCRPRGGETVSKVPPWREGCRVVRVIFAHGWEHDRRRLAVLGWLMAGLAIVAAGLAWPVLAG